MLISLCIIFILSLIIDLASYQREEEQESIIKSLARRTVTWSLLIIVLLIYVIDKIDGQYIWTAFLVGIIFFVTLEIIIPRKAYIYVLQVIGIVTLGGFLAFMTTVFRYELQHQFFKPCWSSDSKRIAFFMQKNLIQYKLGIPFSLWSPNTIWSKNYLCTMDYDGGNFKQIKQTEQATDEISWSGSGEIVYTQHFMQDINTVLQRKIIYTSPDGKETGTLYETAKIPTKTPIKENGIILDPWLSKDKRYLGFVSHFQEPKKETEEDIKLGRSYDNYELIVKDLKTQQTKIDILQKDVKYSQYNWFYGAYEKNMVIYEEGFGENIQKLHIYYLEDMKMETIEKNILFAQLPTTFDLKEFSPDKEMKAREAAIRDKNNNLKVNFYIKSKRSYLFNIFPK